MEKFIIEPNNYLSFSITAFSHADYQAGMWKQVGTIENLITNFKNDIHFVALNGSINKLSQILTDDIPQIYNILELSTPLTIITVPRAKAETNYRPYQLQFKQTVKNIANSLGEHYLDGTDYLVRTINTKTTHLPYDKDGKIPYPGITKDTCKISQDIRGKDILLIDDIYTKEINIDEDAIQTLLDNGAKTVTFYSIGKTKYANQ
jgi:predicted amidophosphoribosyltransferase